MKAPLAGATVQLAASDGQVVYVDPPFNTGKVHSARVGGGRRESGSAAYDDSWGGLTGFLAMLKPRLAALAAQPRLSMLRRAPRAACPVARAWTT